VTILVLASKYGIKRKILSTGDSEIGHVLASKYGIKRFDAASISKDGDLF